MMSMMMMAIEGGGNLSLDYGGEAINSQNFRQTSKPLFQKTLKPLFKRFPQRGMDVVIITTWGQAVKKNITFVDGNFQIFDHFLFLRILRFYVSGLSTITIILNYLYIKKTTELS